MRHISIQQFIFSPDDDDDDVRKTDSAIINFYGYKVKSSVGNLGTYFDVASPLFILGRDNNGPFLLL